MLFFSKQLTFGYCDVSILFPLTANFTGITGLQKQLKSELYFRKKNLAKIKSQVSESVKKLAISFKR